MLESVPSPRRDVDAPASKVKVGRRRSSVFVGRRDIDGMASKRHGLFRRRRQRGSLYARRLPIIHLLKVLDEWFANRTITTHIDVSILFGTPHDTIGHGFGRLAHTAHGGNPDRILGGGWDSSYMLGGREEAVSGTSLGFEHLVRVESGTEGKRKVERMTGADVKLE